MRRDSREDFGASGRQSGEDDRGAARPAWHAIGQRLAALMVTLHLPRPRVNIRAAYAAIVSKAVTIVTLVCRTRTRRARLDPAVGALRNTGLFVRSSTLRWHEAGDSESQLVPANIVITNPSQRQ